MCAWQLVMRQLRAGHMLQSPEQISHEGCVGRFHICCQGRPLCLSAVFPFCLKAPSALMPLNVPCPKDSTATSFVANQVSWSHMDTSMVHTLLCCKHGSLSLTAFRIADASRVQCKELMATTPRPKIPAVPSARQAPAKKTDGRDCCSTIAVCKQNRGSWEFLQEAVKREARERSFHNETHEMTVVADHSCGNDAGCLFTQSLAVADCPKKL